MQKRQTRNKSVVKTAEKAKKSTSRAPRSKSKASAKSTSVPAKVAAKKEVKTVKKATKKKAVPKDTVSDAAISEEAGPEDAVVYSKGTMLAFADLSDTTGKFKIAEVLNDFTNTSAEIQANIFVSGSTITEFKLHSKNQTLFDNQIICDCKVDITEQKGKKNPVTQALKITKALSNKVNKLMPTIVENLKGDLSESDGTESESDHSDDQIALTQPVDSKRKILKIVSAKKSKLPAATQAVTRPQRNKSKGKSDAGMEVDEQPKRVVKGKQLPSIGKKRPRRGKSSDAESGEESEDQPRKQRIVAAAGKTEKIEAIRAQRPKPVPKMPTVYKKGKWNPDVEIEEQTSEFMNDKASAILGCCTRCNNRNVIRAAMHQNVTLLNSCIHMKKDVTNLNAKWGPEDERTAVELIYEKGDQTLLEALFHPKINGLPAEYKEKRDQLLARERGQDAEYLMNVIQTGSVSHMAYGAHVRSVQMTRGNRQGNNAFLDYHDNQSIVDTDFHFLNARALRRRLITPTIFKQLCKVLGGSLQTHGQDFHMITYQNIPTAIRNGDYKLALEMAAPLVKHTSYNLNELHINVLKTYKKGQALPEFKYVNCSKKFINGITPLHFACINPNPEVLEQILKINGDFQMLDQNMRRPIHYAAANENIKCLELLVSKGANLMDIDSQKHTCLHTAVQADRPKCVEYIVSKQPEIVKMRDRSGKLAMVYACENSSIECIKAILKSKDAKINNGVGPERKMPIHYAASQGNFELVQWLIDNKARTIGNDKFKRTPLIMAVRNGHTRVASLLLKHGADWMQPDSSGNTPLHFAAAYGWQDCIDLLIKVGADINAENSWRVTPINIAMLKNHQGCVKKLLEHPDVDVNCKDEKGKTLLTMSLLDLNERTVPFVEYLLKKGADPNIGDIDGQTSLHFLAKSSNGGTQPMRRRWNDPVLTEDQLKAQKATKIKYQLELADLLLSNNASLTAKDKEKKTPFSVCLESDNIDLLDKLIANVSINDEPQLLHAFTSKIFNIKYQNILSKLLNNFKPTHETMNVLNITGLTPFLAFIDHFTNSYVTLRGAALAQITKETQKHGDKVDKFEISNEIILAPQQDQNQHRHSYGNFGRKKAVKKHAFGGGFGGFGNSQATEAEIVELSAEQKNELADTYMKDYILTPFVHCLQNLIVKGADCHMQVQKLERFREIEEEKRKMAMQINADAKVVLEEDKVKKREEVMKKRHAEKKLQVQEQANNGGKPKKEESEYHETMGLQNAYHLLVSCPHPQLLDLLEKHNVNADQTDHKKITPFNLLSTKFAIYDHHTTKHEDYFNRLIRLGVAVDQADSKGRTPFLNYIADNKPEYFEKMLDLGAAVNQMDVTGLFALKYALIRRDQTQIEQLIKRGADINQIDNKGRNLLHHAVNMSSASADATFESEQQLIDFGVNINLKDRHNRTPLHYAFVKIKDWSIKSNIDPIETVSSLCGQKGLEMDVPDKWMKTPLHYAAQRGSSICFIYLNKRGVNKEALDIYGNTPLGVSLLCHHHNAGIMMIQKGCSVLPLVSKETPNKLNKQWEDEAKALGKASGDVEMENDEEKEDPKKKHHKQWDKNQGNDDDDYYDEEDDSENSDEDEDSDDQFEQNAFNNNTAFNNNVFNNNGQPYKANAFGAPPNIPAPEPIQEEKFEEPKTMFRIAINHGQQGLAYSMLDEGYNLMQAMQDAMDEKKFQLCLTLLSKYTDDKIVQQKNSKQQNLFHVLCANSEACKMEHLKRIYETLKKRGVDCLEADGFGRTALHYAVLGKKEELVDMLLVQGADPKTQDIYGHTPLTLYLKGDAIKTTALYDAVTGTFGAIFQKLAKAGADMNTIYPETSFKPEHSGFKDYKCSLLINLIRQLAESDDNNGKLTGSIMGLIEYGAHLNTIDINQRDAMTYAITSNNINIVEFLISQKKHQLDVDFRDWHKKSAAHYVVNPSTFGSFENTEMLEELHEAGYRLDLQDDQGKTPLDYAKDQRSGKLYKTIMRLTGGDTSFVARLSFTKEADWPATSIDWEADSKRFLEVAKNKEEKQLVKDAEEKELVPVDRTGSFERSYKVFCEGTKPWDCYLTKVDLKNGIYGDYVFYKMQLLYDSVRDLYVVFTRWGRIGEDGMNQRTPFPKLDEAQKDFCQIFKSKTGNDFMNLDGFVKAKKKYDIARVQYVTVKHQDYLAPFDLKNAPKSKLEKNTRMLLEEIGNVTMYQKAMNSLGLNTEVLPISGISKEVIQKAQAILKEIGYKVEEDQEISKQGFKADIDALQAVRDKISDLSSRYYELIPLARYKNQIAPPLNNMNLLKQQFDAISDLVNIEQASKILLGALYKQTEVHPIDYLHQALNFNIEFLQHSSPEHHAIHKYIKNTQEGSIDFNTHKVNVFKIERKGEAEKYHAMTDINENHRLLFHGSSLFNYVGIMSQGLRIAPPEAPATGYMFGKGVYFADMYGKSAAYSRTNSDSTVLLLCDVALGKMKRLYQATPVEKLDHGFQSVHGVGRRGPDHSRSLVHPEGVEIPLAPVMEYKEDQEQLAKKAAQPVNPWNRGQNFFYGLQHNEFVVYNTDQVRMRYMIQVVRKTKEEIAAEKRQD